MKVNRAPKLQKSPIFQAGSGISETSNRKMYNAEKGMLFISSFNKKAQLSLTNPRDAVKIRVGSLKVIESDTIQLLAYGFLLPSRSVL